MNCQPFSGLGDRKEGKDPSATSFTGALVLGFRLQPAWIVLECTKEAFSSAWAQQILHEFTTQTGYVLKQAVLDLHTIWPGFRARWWGALTHPMLPAVEIDQLPRLTFVPGILHLVPRLLSLPTEQAEQLNLDEHETRVFHQFKPIIDYNPDQFRPMPTATHSWGSQARGCECGCSGVHEHWGPLLLLLG